MVVLGFLFLSVFLFLSFPCSLRLGYLVRYTVAYFLASLRCFFFALEGSDPSVRLPVLDDEEDLGREVFGRDGWVGSGRGAAAAVGICCFGGDFLMAACFVFFVCVLCCF